MSIKTGPGLPVVAVSHARFKTEFKSLLELTCIANFVIPLTPELVLKILKRISDEDVTFMGFSPIWLCS